MAFNCNIEADSVHAVRTPADSSAIPLGDHGARTLEILRREVSDLGKHMLEDTFRIDEQVLTWCIKGLLKNDLLNDEKKASLNDFLKDDAVLAEIKDVLNMRLRDLKEWEWDLPERGMPVVPRQSLNGKW